MDCLNFPLLISFIRDSEMKFKIEPLVGVIASKIAHHYLTYYNVDVPQYIEEGLPDQLMWSFRAGFNVAHPVSKHFLLNFSPTIDLKIIGNKNVERYGGSYSYSDLPDAILGFKLGLEYGW